MNKILLIAALIIILALRAYDIDAIIKTVDPAVTYEDANAINVFTEVTYDIADDKTFTRKVFYVKKILDYSGQKRYSDVDIEYNPEYEALELVTTMTVTPEGEKIIVPENQIYDLNTDESTWSPEYVQNRKKVISFPQIGPGYYIVLEYNVTDTRKIPASSIEHFQESNPYLEKNLIVHYPKTMSIKYYSGDDLTVTKEENDKKMIKWSVKNSPLIKNEPGSPDYIYSGKPVMFSFYSGWEQFSKDQFINIFNFESSDAIDQLAKKVTADIDGDDEKTYAIYKYIAENFDTKYSYISQMDFKPESLDKVLENRYGSSRELTALFLAMAEASGIRDCKPALLLGHNLNEVMDHANKLVITDQIDEICIYRHGILFMPGDMDRAFGFCGTYEGYLIFNDEAKPMMYSYPVLPVTERNYDIEISGNDIIMNVVSTNTGSYETWMRSFRRFPEDERKMRFFQWLINDNSAELMEGPEFISFDDLNSPIKVSFKVKRKGALIDQDEYLYFMISSFESVPDISLKERTNDLYISSRIFNRYIYNISNPEGSIINIENLAKNFECSDRTAYIKTEFAEEAGKSVYTVEYSIPEMIIPKERYAEFRDFLMFLKDPVNNMVFIKKLTVKE